jgi:hypothetical protein
VFHRIYLFILEKIKGSKILPPERQSLTETKLSRMIQDLGVEFQNFLKENPSIDMAGVLAKLPNVLFLIKILAFDAPSYKCNNPKPSNSRSSHRNPK